MCTRFAVRKSAIAFSFVSLFAFPDFAEAQEGLRPGEAFVTGFSGIQQSGPQNNPVFSIDVNGTVGSIIDIRAPRTPPRGEHWYNEPQRSPIPAAAVGQVFGVVFDDATPPNIYVTSTSAFGLHHTPDGNWMPGMWGPGGPGAIYKLTPTPGGYQPSLFTTVRLNGRPNSGPALGNIAYDKANRQFFVSDLETGMIHRIGLDGTDRGFFDHGTEGRTNFFDAWARQPIQLPPIPFDPNSRARFAECPQQPGDNSPECWNFAANGRRVWGLGIRTDSDGRVRLYYSAWSSPAYDQASWIALSEEDRRNAVWSIGIGPDGSFQRDVRREFMVPDFFVETDDIARAGYSSPVSDISFPACSARPVMLLAERGGIRNLGLANENPFATPHESRTIRLELDTTGAWRPVGRYDIGFYDRQKDGVPFLNANCAGGAAFGPGYSPAGQADLGRPDDFVWISGDSLCSPDGPCNLPASVQQAGGPGAQQPSEGDDSEVHGIQGVAETAIAELAPSAAYQANPNEPSSAPPARAPREAYLIDTDVNVDANGNPIESEFLRNDATLIGDVAVYQQCQPAPVQSYALLPAPPAVIPDEPIVWVGHPAPISHSQYASHGRQMSHYRWGSHYPLMSHGRYGSHSPYWSHNQRMSGWHNTYWSHYPRLSHQRWGSNIHRLPLSPGHYRMFSPGHRLPLSPGHSPNFSIAHKAPLTSFHNKILSGQNHKLPLSPGVIHNPNISKGQHSPNLSLRVPGLPLHNKILSASKPVHTQQMSNAHKPVLSNSKPLHNPQQSNQVKPHNPQLSNAIKPIHSPQLSNSPQHKPQISAGANKPIHNPQISNKPIHTQVMSNAANKPIHSPQLSNKPAHNPQLSNKPIHNPQVSNAQNKPQHNPKISAAANKPVHSPQVSNAANKPVHRQSVSNAANKPVHSQAASNAANKPQHRPQVSNAAQNKPVQNQNKPQHNQQVSNAQKKKHVPATSQFQ